MVNAANRSQSRLQVLKWAGAYLLQCSSYFDPTAKNTSLCGACGQMIIDCVQSIAMRSSTGMHVGVGKIVRIATTTGLDYKWDRMGRIINGTALIPINNNNLLVKVTNKWWKRKTMVGVTLLWWRWCTITPSHLYKLVTSTITVSHVIVFLFCAHYCFWWSWSGKRNFKPISRTTCDHPSHGNGNKYARTTSPWPATAMQQDLTSYDW